MLLRLLRVLRLLHLVVIFINSVCGQIQCRQHAQSLPVPVADSMLGYSNASQTAYLIGGFAVDSETGAGIGLDDAYKWDTTSTSPSSWFTSLPTPAPSAMVSIGVQVVATVNDVIYVVSPSLDTVAMTTGSAIYRFNTTTEQWLAPIDFTTPLGDSLMLSCVTHNETHIILVDGWVSNRDNSPIYIFFYAISANEWTAHALDAPFSATGKVKGGWIKTYCSCVQNSLYIFGGQYIPSSGGSFISLDGIYKYEIASRAILFLGVLPTPQSAGTAVYDGAKYIYLVGGLRVFPEFLDTIRIFDVSTEQLLDETITAVSPFCCGVSMILDEQLWIFGGLWNGFVDDAVQKCDILSLTTMPTTTTPTTTTPTTTTPTTGTPTSETTALSSNATAIRPSPRPTLSISLMPSVSPSPPGNTIAVFTVSIGFNFTSNAPRSTMETVIVNITHNMLDQSVEHANVSDCFEANSSYSNINVAFPSNVSVIVNTTLQLCREEQAEQLRAYYEHELESDALVALYTQTSILTVVADSTTYLITDIINVREREVQNPATTTAATITTVATLSDAEAANNSLLTLVIVGACACGVVFAVCVVLCFCVGRVGKYFLQQHENHKVALEVMEPGLGNVQMAVVDAPVPQVTRGGEHADGVPGRTEADRRRLEEVRQWLLFQVPLMPLKYGELLIENGFDNMDMIAAIANESDLIDIGIDSQSHRQLILGAVRELNNGQRKSVSQRNDEEQDEEKEADEPGRRSSKTRSSDSSMVMHEDHFAVLKVTNYQGIDDAQKMEIFDRRENGEQNEDHAVNGPDTKG